jgi:hypothetical protein
MMTMMTMMTATELAPQHRAVYQAVMAELPAAPRVGAQTVTEIRASLRDRVASATEDLGRGAVRLDRHVLVAALACPASSARPPFEWSAQLACRRLGIGALSASVRGSRADLVALVDQVLADEMEQSTSLGDWVASLGVPQRVAVAASAVGWAARARLAVPWSSWEHISFRGDSVRWRHAPSIQLDGRADATLCLGASGSRERVIINLGFPDAAVQRFDVLCATLAVGRAPLRCVSVHPGSGRIAVLDVDEVVLVRAVDDVARAVRELAAPPLAETPGVHCWRCWRHRDCEPGTVWRAAHPRRVAGIPVAPPPATAAEPGQVLTPSR